MYLWKYWRESRIVFGAAVLVIAALFIETLRQSERWNDVHQLANILPAFLWFQSVPLGFLAWFFGSFGIGRDLGERSGSFICSRPVRRSYFVWCDWACGLAELLIIVILCHFVLWLQIHFLLLSAGDPLHGRVPFPDGTSASLVSIFYLAGAIAFLLIALIFSLTYFSTVVVKNARGIIYGAGILVGYVFVAARIKHYWPTVELPSLLLRQFTLSRGIVTGFADHLSASMAIRAGIILLFPFAAQIVLEKRDI